MQPLFCAAEKILSMLDRCVFVFFHVFVSRKKLSSFSEWKLFDTNRYQQCLKQLTCKKELTNVSALWLNKQIIFSRFLLKSFRTFNARLNFF